MSVVLVTCIVEAKCDPPPPTAAFGEPREDVEALIEDALARWLLDYGARFTIRTTWTIDR